MFEDRIRDDPSGLLERIADAFARGDETLGHDLVAEAIERHEMPADLVAAALSAGVEASSLTHSAGGRGNLGERPDHRL